MVDIIEICFDENAFLKCEVMQGWSAESGKIVDQQQADFEAENENKNRACIDLWHKYHSNCGDYLRYKVRV